MPEPTNDSPKAEDDRLVALLASGAPKAVVARQLGKTREHISRRWNAEPELRAAVRKQATILLENFNRELSALTAKATVALRDLLTDDDPRIRLRATEVVLNRSDKIHDVAIVARMEELEQQLRSLNHA